MNNYPFFCSKIMLGGIMEILFQKLNEFIKRNKNHPVYQKHLVLIFDECHRSQFGNMHKTIIKNLKKYHLFGFTGTPIFPENINNKSNICTTEQAFGDKLHTYTIVNAIDEGNVLPFRIDYVKNKKEERNTEKSLHSNKRISEIVKYIIEHFDQKTKRNSFYDLKEQRKNGFNSIFTVDSRSMVKKYYLEFKKQLEEKNKDLTIAAIYSFEANEESIDGILSDEEFEIDLLDKNSKEFLEFAIGEYNKKFKINFSLALEIEINEFLALK